MASGNWGRNTAIGLIAIFGASGCTVMRQAELDDMRLRTQENVESLQRMEQAILILSERITRQGQDRVIMSGELAGMSEALETMSGELAEISRKQKVIADKEEEESCATIARTPDGDVEVTISGIGSATLSSDGKQMTAVCAEEKVISRLVTDFMKGLMQGMKQGVPPKGAPGAQPPRQKQEGGISGGTGPKWSISIPAQPL